MLTKLNWGFWRRVLMRLVIRIGVIVTIAFGLIVIFAWIALLVRGFAALISWVI